MESLVQVLRKSADFLAAKGIENARLNAELIFADCLKCQRLDLYLMHERPMAEQELDALRPLIVRRGKREPLQHILGETDFYGLQIQCDQRALIPRPETEELVERITIRLKEHQPSTILDLGTGSGAIALALARAFPEAKVTALDASEDALSLARENASKNDMAERVAFLSSIWFGAIEGKQFDLIVSNPPYLTEAEWESAQPEVRNFDPREALVGSGEDGANDLCRILREAIGHLHAGGLLALETGIAQSSALETAAQLAGYADFSIERDDSGRPRYFFASR